MIATSSINTDEAIITVPAKRALQVTTGGSCPAGDDFAAVEDWQQLPWWAQLAMLVLREAKAGERSFLKDWVASLPRDFPEIPMNWSEDELGLLEYPPIHQQIEKQRLELQEAFQKAQSCRLDFSEAEFRWAVQVVRSRAFSGPYEGRNAKDRLAQLAFTAALAGVAVASGALSLEASLNGALAAALAIPLQDFLVGQTSELKRHVVCPVVDYLNHDSNAISDIAYEYFGNMFAVRVNGAFEDGEEVCINYGEKRSNDTLLQFYGFVERDNANDTYTVDLLQHLDEEAAANGQKLEVRLSRTGPDDESLERLLSLLADGRAPGPNEEAMAWKAVAIACEAELQRRSAGAAHQLEMAGTGVRALASRFAIEKEKVLLACRAHAESRCRPATAAPLSLLSRATIVPSFQDAETWKHDWAHGIFTASDLAALRSEGFVVLPAAFDASLASTCREECEKLDTVATTVTTNRCNRGSRSAWLDFGYAEGLAELEERLPALTRLGRMLAGLPAHVHGLGGFGEALQVHPAAMIAVYPEQAATYALHKDSYAPADNDPATGATRRLTILAYLNDWREGHGGELRLHSGKEKPACGGTFPLWEPLGHDGCVAKILPAVGLAGDTAIPLKEVCRLNGASFNNRDYNRESFKDALSQILGELESSLLEAHERSTGSGRRRSRVECTLDQSVESDQPKEGPVLTLSSVAPHAKLSYFGSPTESVGAVRSMPSGGENSSVRARKQSSVSRKSTASARSRVRPSAKIAVADPRTFHNTFAEKRLSEESDQEVKARAMSGSKDEGILRLTLAAWKEYAFHVDNDDDDISEHELEVLKESALREWPSDPEAYASLTRMLTGELNSSKADDERRNSFSESFWRKRLITRPHSRKRMLWDLFGLVLVVWDIFAIPMNAFELTDVAILTVVNWTSTVFWTIDLPTNFFNSFYRAGHVVLDPREIALQYLRTWFTIDVSVLGLDWCFLALDVAFASDSDEDGAGNNYLRIMRMSRGLKILRILRLVRLAKLFPKFHTAFVAVQSDSVRLSLGALFAVVIVVTMNHYVACGWFALGYWDTSAPVTWVAVHDLSGDLASFKGRLGYQYFTSLHWALCQFTPASIEVNAVNTSERIYTVCTIICGLISFSSFVSNITSSMTQLRNLNSEKQKQQASLRQYFSQNEVPPEVSKCIYDWINSHRKNHRVRVHEDDVEPLAEVPERLKFKLREAVYRPVLCRHPFFMEFREADGRTLDRLCHQALSEIRVSTEHTIFMKGQQALGMYFVNGGELEYWRSALVDPVPIQTGDWLSEVALWVNWRHCGTLAAKCQSDLMHVDTDMFKSLIATCSKVGRRLVRGYAASFVRHECEAQPPGAWLGDLCCGYEAIAALLENTMHKSQPMEEHLKSVTATDLFKDHCRESVFPCSVGLEKMTPVLAIGTHEVRKPRTKLEL
ncbi:eag [Symbiodinium pilosum]|uniref:Eag protein n=1 Tax=Symbiodinium pilosum TaxID=2952 RepID=A0A812T7U3_SYMPI|nr:eag [Symbiodinium pilosum]